MGTKKIVPASDVRRVVATVARTRVTNGRELLPGIDGRTYWARRTRDVLSLFVSDLGGSEACSEAEKAILRRAAVLVVQMEALEVRFASNPGHISHPDLDLYGRLAGHLRRLLDTTGLERRSRDITPTIDQYMADVADVIDLEAAE